MAEGQLPSLTYLEDKYGHLVEKEFWYNRVVKLTNTYKELCKGGKDVFDMSHAELEEAAGHLVTYTAEEKEYLQLLENYKQSKVQIDGIPTLEYLRRHHSKSPAPPASPEYDELPDLSEGEDQVVEEALNVDNRYVGTYSCPIHEDSVMRCLNADEVCGALLFKCERPDCAVFYTSDSHQAVCHQLRQATHPTVHQVLFHANLKCYCDFTPRMKLSRSEKNYERVFLTCFKKKDPCNYFQWIHWKVRPPQGPMDRYAQKQEPSRLYYTRGLPTQVPRQLWQTSQQMIGSRKMMSRFYPPNPGALASKEDLYQVH